MHKLGPILVQEQSQAEFSIFKDLVKGISEIEEIAALMLVFSSEFVKEKGTEYKIFYTFPGI